MSTVFKGSLTVGVVLPILLQAQAQLSAIIPALQAAINLYLPELSAKIQGLGKASLQIQIKPPSVAGTIQAAGNLIASLQLSPPSVSASAILTGIGAKLAILIAIKEQLEASLDLVDPALELALKISEICATAGVRLFVFTGELGQLGADIQAQIADGGSLGPLGVDAGVSAGAQVYVPLLVVEANSNAQIALKYLFNL